VFKIMKAAIPVYLADGGLYACVTEQRLAMLQTAGLVARVVRSRKGQIQRAILLLRPGDPRPISAGSVAGTRYSFKESLKHGRAWELKHLDGSSSEKNYAPSETRAEFFKVVTDCSGS
jgi:hypothetical protein